MKQAKIFSIIMTVIFLTIFTFQTVQALTQTKYHVNYEVVGGTDEQVKVMNQHTFYGNKNQVQVFENEESIFCFLAENEMYITNELKYTFRLVRDTNFTAYFKNPDNYYILFLGGNDKVISFQEVKPGEDAVSPEFDVSLEGYQFVRWNTDITNVQEDLIVRPVYSKVKSPYTVTVEINGQVTTTNSYLGQILEFEAPNKIGENNVFSHWIVNGKKRSISNVLKISVYEDLEISAFYSYANHYEEIVAYINDKVVSNGDKIFVMGAFDVRGSHDVVEFGVLLLPKDNPEFNLKNPYAIKLTAYKLNEANEFAISIPVSYQGYIAKAYVIEKIVNSNNLNEFLQVFSEDYIKITLD